MKTEETLARLSEECANTITTAGKLGKDVADNGLNEFERFVPYWAIQGFINEVRKIEKFEEQEMLAKLPVKQFLFVEDGTVDFDNLVEDLKIRNPEIKVVVYRQGANMPQLINNTTNGDK